MSLAAPALLDLNVIATLLAEAALAHPAPWVALTAVVVGPALWRRWCAPARSAPPQPSSPMASTGQFSMAS
ncbi:MAG: hypothetical protein H6739_08530 [Alphaproteobacteria bacterium]|nr:hypothetical protein [Alphaproteobacteria bacterium]